MFGHPLTLLGAADTHTGTPSESVLQVVVFVPMQCNTYGWTFVVRPSAMQHARCVRISEPATTLTVNIDDGAIVAGDCAACVSRSGHNDVVTESDGVASANRTSRKECGIAQHQRVQHLEAVHGDAVAGTASTANACSQLSIWIGGLQSIITRHTCLTTVRRLVCRHQLRSAYRPP
jgi:hypothetical protein